MQEGALPPAQEYDARSPISSAGYEMPLPLRVMRCSNTGNSLLCVVGEGGEKIPTRIALFFDS